MACKNSWSVKFRNVKEGQPFEVRPITLDLNLNRNKYDFARATFSREVGGIMEEESFDGGKLDKLLPVDICYNGEEIKRLLFRPDWAEFSNSRTRIQFQDVHKALAESRVNIKRDKIEVKEIYKEVINSGNNNIIPEIDDDNFTFGDDQVTTVFGNLADGVDLSQAKEIERRTDQRAVSTDAAVDFNNISSEKAIAKLNSIFYLKSWSNSNGDLMIGVPEDVQSRHIATERDNRVWRYKSANVSHGREPIKEVLIKGPWLDAPGISATDGLGQIASIFDSSNERGWDDVQAWGIATRTDIEDGLRVKGEATDASKNSLDTIAESALKEEIKQQNSGRVKIDPNRSGSSISNVVDARPGDTLRLVPSDESFDNPTAQSGELGDKPENYDRSCGSFLYNEEYLLTNISHNIEKSGNWHMSADIGIFPNVPIKTSIALYDPNDNDWVSDSPLSSDGELTGGWLQIENFD